MNKPTVGRIVHYVLETGRHLPAIITDCSESDETVNLFVFWDARVPQRYDFEKGVIDCKQDEKEKVPSTWHWPERV